VKRWSLVPAALAAALLLAAAGCGGGGDDSSSSSTESTTTSTTGGPQNARLTQAQWSEYEQEKAQAQQVNQAGIKTFKKCRVLVDQGKPSEQVEACFGESTTSVVTEGQKLLTFIAEIGGTVNGACGQATANLHDQVKLYISSVNALGLSAGVGTVPPVQSVDAAQAALVKAKADTAAFETACKPA
jgi:hypothetical protein